MHLHLIDELVEFLDKGLRNRYANLNVLSVFNSIFEFNIMIWIVMLSPSNEKHNYLWSRIFFLYKFNLVFDMVFLL